jgi:hypothetical protein
MTEFDNYAARFKRNYFNAFRALHENAIDAEELAESSPKTVAERLMSFHYQALGEAKAVVVRLLDDNGVVGAVHPEEFNVDTQITPTIGRARVDVQAVVTFPVFIELENADALPSIATLQALAHQTIDELVPQDEDFGHFLATDDAVYIDKFLPSEDWEVFDDDSDEPYKEPQ